MLVGLSREVSSEDPPCRFRRARRTTPEGVGIEFDEVNEDLHDFVRRLLDACREALAGN